MLAGVSGLTGVEPTMNRRLTSGLTATGAVFWLTLGLAVLAASCGGESQAPAASVLNRSTGPEPESVDPQLARSTQAHMVLRDLFEGLLSYSPDGQLIGGVAERWEISADGRAYTFHLRPDARWSNGDPVVAEDFVFTFRRLVDPSTASAYAEHLRSVVNALAIVAGKLPPDTLGVEARGPHELLIHLERPSAHFLFKLALPPSFPVNAANLKKYGDQFSRPGNLISNGAYVLKGWTLGSVLHLERNEWYWNNEATSIDTVRYHVNEEPSAELNRYRAGELHITDSVPTDAFQQLSRERPDELRVAPTLSVYFYGFNLTHPALGGKPKLREALSLAIDREELAHKVLARGEAPAYSFVPPGTNNYEPPRLPYADMSTAERHQRARQLYAEAGYDEENPFEIEVRYNTSDTHRRIAVAIQHMWREVLGVEAELINEEFRSLIANVTAKQNTEIFRLNWRGVYNDAYAFLDIFETDHPSNFFAYGNEDYDELLARAAQQTEPLPRREYMEQAERVMLADLPVIPLYFYVSKHLVASNIRGWQDNILDYHYSQHLSFDDGR